MIKDTRIRLERALKKFSLPLECADELLEYLELLNRWNRKINLVSRRQKDIVGSLLIPSFLFFKLIENIKDEGNKNARLVDVGSGAGFPGFIIKLCDKERGVTLVDSNARKAAFLTYVCAYFSLEGCSVINSAICEIEKENKPPSIVTARGIKIDGKMVTCLKEKAGGKWLVYFTSPRNRLPLKRIDSLSCSGVEATLYEL